MGWGGGIKERFSLVVGERTVAFVIGVGRSVSFEFSFFVCVGLIEVYRFSTACFGNLQTLHFTGELIGTLQDRQTPVSMGVISLPYLCGVAVDNRI